MRSVAIKTRAGIYILIYIGLILLISMMVLAGGYYWFSIQGIKTELEDVGEEMITNRIFMENKQIKFRRDDEGRTLSGYLRDMNMSAGIWDEKGISLAKYGVFQNNNEITYVPDMTNGVEYRQFETYSKERYQLLSIPILEKGVVVGKLVLATPLTILGHTKEIGGTLIVTVLVLSLLLSWPLSHQLVDLVFKSLDDLVKSMRSVGIENLEHKIEYQGAAGDEIDILVKSYNRLLERLADGVNKQKTFISNASHELKTPLARIVSTVEVLGPDIKDKNSKRMLDEIKSELMMLSKKVEALLLLSRYDDGKTKIIAEQFDPAAIIKGIVKKIKEKTTVDLDHVGLVRGDKIGFELVMENLISNAIKYNKKDGVVKIRLTKADGGILAEIVDQGEGIDNKILGSIFERFNREEKYQGKIEGFGVGLSLVKQICDRNNWQVVYEPNGAQGTKVRLFVRPG